jgi:hypothetical protein
LDLGFSARSLSRDDRKHERDDKKSDRHPSGEAGEHIRGLGSEDIVRDSATKRGAEALAAGALHENHKNQQDAHNDVNGYQYRQND